MYKQRTCKQSKKVFNLAGTNEFADGKGNIQKRDFLYYLMHLLLTKYFNFYHIYPCFAYTENFKFEPVNNYSFLLPGNSLMM